MALDTKNKLCWYCGKRPRTSPDALFCKVCEKIKKKEVVRTQYENAQSPRFGKGTKKLGV